MPTLGRCSDAVRTKMKMLILYSIQQSEHKYKNKRRARTCVCVRVHGMINSQVSCSVCTHTHMLMIMRGMNRIYYGYAWLG